MHKRAAAAAIVLAMLTAACGARLTDEQAATVAGGDSNSAGGPVNIANIPGVAPTTAPAGPAAGPAGAPDSPDPAAPGPAVAQDPGAPDPGAAPDPAQPQTTQPPTAARKAGDPPPPAPADGNGGATDIGVTADKIVLGVIADRSGPVPGLFEASIQGMQAWATLVNQQGGIYGRQVEVRAFDSKTDSAQNRAAVLDACDKVFALVGSMSAFDQGAATTVDECGIPDLNATVVNPERYQTKNSYMAFPNPFSWYVIGPAQRVKRNQPEVITQAGIIWVDAAVGDAQQKKVTAGQESIGFKFVFNRPASPVESNYGPFVLEMKNKNVQYLTAVGDAGSHARMMQAMKQQNYRPAVIDFTSGIYSDAFLQQAGDAANGLTMSLNTHPFQEPQTNPEMQLYLNLIGATSGGKPDLFGLYSWSAGRLFTEIAVAIGPNLTRAAMFEQLAGWGTWDSIGLHAPHLIGEKKPSDCFLIMTVEAEQWKRLDPPQGFNCEFPIAAVPGF